MIAVVLAEFIGSELSKMLIVGSSVVAVALLVSSVSVLLGRRQAQVERRLAGYEMPDFVAAHAGTPGSSLSRPPETAFVQQGVELASRLARRSGAFDRLERMLEQADLPIRAGELIFYTPVFAIFAFMLLSILVSPILGIATAAVALLVPFAYISSRRSKRLRRFETMLPATLTLMASSMRAGFSLIQALEAVSQEAGEPMRREMQRVFTEVRLGRPIEDALSEVAERMESRDLGWTVMAIRIQREVGGNLASLLDTVADTMTKRQALRREIRALTAEGRLSAIVLSMFPPLLGLVLYIVQPDYMEKLFDEAIGIAAVIGAVLLNIAGWLWLRQVVNIED